MRQTITISLPEELKSQLEKLCRKEGVSRSDIVRESLRDYMFIREFRNLRAKMLGEAKAQGIHIDEDVFKRVS